MNNNNERVALHVMKGAKNNSFIDCNIVGGARIEGEKTEMIRTKIVQFSKDHPILWSSFLITLVAGLVTGIILLAIEYGLLTN